MANLARHALKQQSLADDDDHQQKVLAVWETLQRQWVCERLPSLIAAMRLVLQVYDTYGPGMTRIHDPLEAGIWNKKYLVGERELSLASIETS